MIDECGHPNGDAESIALTMTMSATEVTATPIATHSSARVPVSAEALKDCETSS